MKAALQRVEELLQQILTHQLRQKVNNNSSSIELDEQQQGSEEVNSKLSIKIRCYLKLV